MGAASTSPGHLRSFKEIFTWMLANGTTTQMNLRTWLPCSGRHHLKASKGGLAAYFLRGHIETTLDCSIYPMKAFSLAWTSQARLTAIRVSARSHYRSREQGSCMAATLRPPRPSIWWRQHSIDDTLPFGTCNGLLTAVGLPLTRSQPTNYWKRWRSLQRRQICGAD